MNKVEGLHHIAICTSDMKGQIEFFTDKLGMELQALYWMHGVENTFHGFLRLNDESSVALVHNPDIDKIPVELGKTHAGNPGAPCSRGTMQHLAFKVKNHEELMAMRDRLRSKGVPVVGPMDHGLCCSIYFAGLENLALAFTPTDCTAQGAFMNRLLEPVDGFVVLDLHNLYCQMRNFQLEAEVLLQTFPWSRVREIHISGGSEPQGFRRDTHDDLVPEEVWALLDGVRGRAPSLELIVLERLGGTIADPESFASEFRRLREVAERWW